MAEQDLRDCIRRAKQSHLSRRDLMQLMAAMGLAAPLASQLLAGAGVAMAQTTPLATPMATPTDTPAKRGGGGVLRVLWWQAPTLLNPHFAVGTKDQDGARMFYEPLASWDQEGNLVPVLAAEVPSLENGGLAKDGKSVTWKLKQGVQWHDGMPFTADDVVFNWQYARNPATATVTSGTYKDITVEKIDQYTVRVLFASPRPFWADAFVGIYGMIIPQHLYAPYAGANSRDAPANLHPVGTGPYKFKDFKPGDSLSGEINANYHQPGRPYFDAVDLKGGGDAVSAARAVLQTGEFHFAWNLQIEDEVLKRLEATGKGRVLIYPTGQLEQIQLNFTDPWTEVDGERASIKTDAPDLERSGGARRAGAAGRSGFDPEVHLRPDRRVDPRLHQQAGSVPLIEHRESLRCRPGGATSGRSGVAQSSGRHPRKEWQAAEVCLPELDQPAAPEDAGGHQAGLPEGGHRD